MYRIIIIVLLSVFFTISINIFGQNQEDFTVLEQKLNKKALAIIDFHQNAERLEQNNKLYDLFLETLHKDGSFDYPFDSLETISVLRSPDEKFRIITWYLPLVNGYYEYYGFFQIKDKSANKKKIYELTHPSEKVEEAEFKELNHKNWFGAYYYDLIHSQYAGKDYYTLLGWKGKNPLVRQRLIEPIRLNSENEPVFGQPILSYKDDYYCRAIFSYSSRVSMELNYDSLLLINNANIDSKQIKTSMIVFDRLDPIEDSLENHYQFYKPVTNISDGFIFKNGKWVFFPNIDARNPEREIPEPERIELK